MAKQFTQPDGKVVIDFQNKQPLDLIEVTTSLAAVGEQFRRYATREMGESVHARLKIGAVRSGSLITELTPYLQGLDWALDHRSLVTPFVNYVGDALQMLWRFPPKARELPAPDVRAAKQLTAPVAKDEGSTVSIYAAEGATVTTNVFNFGTNAARSIRKHADIVLAAHPDEIPFDDLPMALYQMRDAVSGGGDYGIIDRFGPSPVKIRWASEEVKAQVFNQIENPLHMFFFVSGCAQTAGGKPASFLIRRVNDTSLRPVEDRQD